VWLPPSITAADAAELVAAYAGSGTPVVGSRTEHLRAGAAVVVRPDPNDVGADAAALMRRILDGADPAKLPVARARKLLVDVDLAAARRLRFEMPLSFLARADSISGPRGAAR